MGRRNEYQPKGGDALRLGSKGMVWFVCGWQVKLCGPIVTHGRYLSALEIRGLRIKHYINSSVYTYLLTVFTIIFIHQKCKLVQTKNNVTKRVMLLVCCFVRITNI